MKASRRVYMIAATLAAVTFAVSSLSTILAHAQSADAAAVEQAGETLRKLMINPDQPALEQIFADQLSYGHSDGRVQTKAEFVDALVNGKSVFKSISLTVKRYRSWVTSQSCGIASRPMRSAMARHRGRASRFCRCGRSRMASGACSSDRLIERVQKRSQRSVVTPGFSRARNGETCFCGVMVSAPWRSSHGGALT
jgi:hypothetical protein